jgi:hypothetical protein
MIDHVTNEQADWSYCNGDGVLEGVSASRFQSVKHQMEALGRLDPFDPIEKVFTRLWPATQGDNRDWTALATEANDKVAGLGNQLAGERNAREIAEGELSVVQAKLRDAQAELVHVRTVLEADVVAAHFEAQSLTNQLMGAHEEIEALKAEVARLQTPTLPPPGETDRE